MARGISWGGTSLPVTDAQVSASRDPIREQSMNGLGGEILYGGVYAAAQGSFSGAARASVIGLIDSMLETEPGTAGVTAVVSDDHGNALTANNCFLTSAEVSVKTGELAKASFNFVGRSLTAGGSVGAASYSAAVPVFYNSSTSWGTASAFSIKVEKPFAADDYVLGGDFYSQSIYQSGETSVSGTITLGQLTGYSLSDPGAITFTLGSVSTISITGAVLSNTEISVSGRGLIGKTFSWAAPSTGITIN